LTKLNFSLRADTQAHRHT